MRQLAGDHGFAPLTGRTDETNDATDAAPCWLWRSMASALGTSGDSGLRLVDLQPWFLSFAEEVFTGFQRGRPCLGKDFLSQPLTL